MEEKDKKVKKETTKTTRKKKVEVEQLEEIKEEPVKVKEVIVEKQSGFNYAEVIVIMIITLILGGVIGSFITYVTKDNKTITKTIIKGNGKDSKNASDKFDEFIETYQNIVENYYKDVDSNELIEAGINGMLEYLGDDYSVYMDKDLSQAFNEQVEGKYKGVGIEIVLEADGRIGINRVFSNSPAAKAGVQKGDHLVSIDGVSVEGRNATDIASEIRNSDREKVTIVVDRNGEQKTFELTLKEVTIDSVESRIFEQNGVKIGYIELRIFASNTFEQFEKHLKDLESKKIDKLIIDVRGNSGGYLTTVTDIASLFLNKSKIIYQLDTKGVVEQVYSETKESRNYDVVVLIDGASASASEILAAAMKESYGAKLIGKTTYGKGTVQAAYQLDSGATVKYTIQKWLTPNGNWIDSKGVAPDIEVDLTVDYLKNPIDENDAQLQKALEELSK